MESNGRSNSKSIFIRNKSFPAVTCEKCGAKMYPRSLLKPHLTRHQQGQRWFTTELRKLQYIMAHMRDIA